MAKPKKPVIALLYDFDKTLSPRDMQEYSFIPKLGIEPTAFWQECAALAKAQHMDKILTYLYLMIDRARAAHQPIRREDFVKLGADIEFFPGVTDWFDRIGKLGDGLGLTIEHYIISSGLKEIIEGSAIYKRFKEVYACEFFYDASGVAVWPRAVVNYTTKTQFLFRINKGVLDVSDDDALNRYTREEERRVQFRNMIYIGDGLTDVPCMKLVKVNHGHSIAVHPPRARAKVEPLLADNRVDFIAQADYSAGKELEALIAQILRKLAIDNQLQAERKKQQ